MGFAVMESFMDSLVIEHNDLHGIKVTMTKKIAEDGSMVVNA